jgi:hypothetical protein
VRGVCTCAHGAHYLELFEFEVSAGGEVNHL